MSTSLSSRRAGFALIEALIALLLISIGLIAVSKLQTASIVGAGDGRARAEAANLSQQKIEELRNLLRKSDFETGVLKAGTYTGTVAADVSKGRVNDYTLTWTISTPDASLEKRQVLLTTTWTDAKGVIQRLDMNSELAWDEPSVVATVVGSNAAKNLISPTGEAQRGGSLPAGLSPTIVNHDGSRIYTDSTGKTYLTNASDKVLIYLLPKNGVAQAFTRITGRVFFDPQGGKDMPPANEVLVRLSSEGECIYNNAVTLTLNFGGKNFTYLPYACYVGPGWYGNVGVTVVDKPGNTVKHNVCVGDPGFAKSGTRTSAHPELGSARAYRGFRSTATTSGYQSTGMAGGRYYGTSFSSNGAAMTGPFDGRPRPSDYPLIYGTVDSASDYLNQDFLVTDKADDATGCKAQMQGGPFAKNAGGFVCISPDNDGAADECPSEWPGYGAYTGTVNNSCDVTGSMIDGEGTVKLEPLDGSGNVISLPSGESAACKQVGKTKGINCEFVNVSAGQSFRLTNLPGKKSTTADYVGLLPITFTLDCQAPPTLVFKTP